MDMPDGWIIRQKSGRMSSAIVPNNKHWQQTAGNLDAKPVMTDAEMVLSAGDYSNGEYTPLDPFTGARLDEVIKVNQEITSKRMVSDLNESNFDVHRLAASRIFGVAPEDVTPGQRAQAKTMTYGALYSRLGLVNGQVRLAATKGKGKGKR